MTTFKDFEAYLMTLKLDDSRWGRREPWALWAHAGLTASLMAIKK